MKIPPSYGEPLGPSRTKYHLRMFDGSGRAVICGGGSREMLRNSLRRRCCKHEKQAQASCRGGTKQAGQRAAATMLASRNAWRNKKRTVLVFEAMLNKR